ncbi:PREDICTED: cleft lip and palate transmembrane protein 1 homolog [Ceratosolen solmsi marchali]|uniref:Cleft lip and palate transmembrane protein 1 homolog n=1 Tax=Ceratosolen solmsi marchali TaxID=326594 RepID=A0AAJ6VMQ7_9HYME|nr:PREDICTED: cleft lip and palate transmembrane protein 1 homolog [Ceratosolen solmsi marchali]
MPGSEDDGGAGQWDSERTSSDDNVAESHETNNGELVPLTNADGEAQQTVNNQEVNQRPKPNETYAQSFYAITKSLIIRAAIIYYISSFFRNPAQNSQASAGNSAAAQNNAFNIFANGTVFDLHVYLSEYEFFKDFNDSKAKVWSEYGLIYGDWYSGPNGDGSKVFTHTFTPSKSLLNNGSIYLHVYVTKNGKSPDPSTGQKVYAGEMMSYTKKMLNKFKKIKYLKMHNLLTGQTQSSEEDIKKADLMDQEIVSHWHPNLTINLVTDQSNWVRGMVPETLDDYIQFTSNGKFYKPVIFMNDFWNMQRDYQPLNNTVTKLELQLNYQPLSLFKWELFSAQSMRNKWTSSVFGDTVEDNSEHQDTLKEALLENNPYLLGMTIIVSIFHSVFEFLAFKNDIQFWNNRKSLEGLSVRSVFFNVFQSLVVMLYVLDNEANTLIRIGCGVGLAIEIWKINKVVDIKVDRSAKVFGIFPRLIFKDKGSYVESSTKEYDRLAFKYLSWALFPLLGGYAIYSLMYLEHKGWYSWVLNMLYGFLLTFGFIMMTPQLFINYKLKSVAHLPWRMMSYKFLNTFIDDIFAFVIKMPTLYRLGCFRDDIVFFIFLYQHWIYKTDHTRINEFGFSGEADKQVTDDKNQAIENKDNFKEDKKIK